MLEESESSKNLAEEGARLGRHPICPCRLWMDGLGQVVGRLSGGVEVRGERGLDVIGWVDVDDLISSMPSPVRSWFHSPSSCNPFSG